jgi:hypothetical protein
MRIDTEILIFFLTVVLTIVGYFLNRILSRITIYEEKLNQHTTSIALNKQAIEDMKKAA